MYATTETHSQRTIPITRHQPDRLIHLNRSLTRVTAFSITGPVVKHSPNCYSMMCRISCRQGEVDWLAHTFSHPTKGGWRIYGDPYLPTYAAVPIRAAIYAAISEYIASEVTA